MSLRRLTELNTTALFAFMGGMLVIFALIGRDKAPSSDEKGKTEADDTVEEQKGKPLLEAGSTEKDQGLETPQTAVENLDEE